MYSSEGGLINGVGTAASHAEAFGTSPSVPPLDFEIASYRQ